MQQIVEIIGHIEEREPSLDDALPLVLSQYLNEKCKYCGKPFLTLSDLDTSVWVGYNEHGRIAHKSCYETEVESLAVPTLMRLL